MTAQGFEGSRSYCRQGLEAIRRRLLGPLALETVITEPVLPSRPRHLASSVICPRPLSGLSQIKQKIPKRLSLVFLFLLPFRNEKF